MSGDRNSLDERPPPAVDVECEIRRVKRVFRAVIVTECVRIGSFEVVIVTEPSPCIEQSTPRPGKAPLTAAWNVNPVVAHHRHPLFKYSRYNYVRFACKLDVGVGHDRMGPGPRSRQRRQRHGSGE